MKEKLAAFVLINITVIVLVAVFSLQLAAAAAAATAAPFTPPPPNCAAYYALFTNDNNFLIDPCNSSQPFACVYMPSDNSFLTNRCYATKSEADACTQNSSHTDAASFDLTNCFAMECPPCTPAECEALTPYGFCDEDHQFTCLWPLWTANEAYITPCQSDASHWIDTSKCGKCCATNACQRPPLSCPLMNSARCRRRYGNYAVCPYDKPLVCVVVAMDSAPSPCFATPEEAPALCFTPDSAQPGGAVCADSRSCATSSCSSPCTKAQCLNISRLCPLETPFQCTGDYSRDGVHTCSADKAHFERNTDCSACCDTTTCEREPLHCDRPCSEAQCDLAYSSCSFDSADPISSLLFAAPPPYQTAISPTCFTKSQTWSLPKHKSKDALSCCSSTKSCNKNKCWQNVFQCSENETACPQLCSPLCQPCDNECGGNACSSQCSPCPHCCGWANCPACQCPSRCFSDGNCFGECVCGTPNCPSNSFWKLLQHNVSNSFRSHEERASAQRELEGEIASGRVSAVSLKKELHRLHRFFFNENAKNIKKTHFELF